MTELKEICRIDKAKDSQTMRYFFQKMIDERNLNAYSVEVNKEIVEQDTSDERVVRIAKGATLTRQKT